MILMNKIEFAKLNKEQMIIAFNQLKDDYSNLFNQLEEKYTAEQVFTIWLTDKFNKTQDTTYLDVLMKYKKILERGKNEQR